MFYQYLKASCLFCGLFFLFLSTPLAAQDWELVWSDEFDGTSLDANKWSFQTGDGCPDLCGWGNNELQWYQSDNISVSDGLLTITAREEQAGGKNYTSSRIRTINRGDWTYGRFEIRAKMPEGKGLWPALWMLPTDPSIYGVWAASGEIDIVEVLGDKPEEALGTLHYGGSWPDNQKNGATFALPQGSFSDDFHVFAVEWFETEIRWFIDDQQYATITNWSSSGGAFPAPFDVDFHILMNVAVGGNLPGNPDATTSFPQAMQVDYVRVYESTGTGNTGSTDFLFDDMEHGNPLANGWFSFNGDAGGGGITQNSADVEPTEGGSFSLETGWGGGGNAGFYGGFGRTNRTSLPSVTHFNFWVNPNAGQSYTLEINLQDDDDGDDQFPSPSTTDDEYQYDCVIGPAGPCATSGGGWQFVSIPIEDFADDNSFHTGGNSDFDPVSVASGGNGQLINIVFAVQSTGTDVNFRTDNWFFSDETPTSIEDNGPLITDYTLSPAYPNPFYTTAQFDLQLDSPQNIRIDLFDILGRKVKNIYEGVLAADNKTTFAIDGLELPSGIYIYKVSGETFSQARQVLLVKN